MDEGAVEPLNIVVPWQREQHLIADDGEGQKQDGTQGDCQGKGAQLQPDKWKGRVSPALTALLPHKPHFPPRLLLLEPAGAMGGSCPAGLCPLPSHPSPYLQRSLGSWDGCHLR